MCKAGQEQFTSFLLILTSRIYQSHNVKQVVLRKAVGKLLGPYASDEEVNKQVHTMQQIQRSRHRSIKYSKIPLIYVPTCLGQSWPSSGGKKHTSRKVQIAPLRKTRISRNMYRKFNTPLPEFVLYCVLCWIYCDK